MESVMKKSTDQIREEIFQFLKANGILSLAVASDNTPWLCTLYYGIDDWMNLYVVTDPNNNHGKIMTRNPKVAFNIFDSGQKITEPKKGLQGRGKIAIVKEPKSVTRALGLWHKANPGVEEMITAKHILDENSDTKIFKITPTYLKYFNKQFYGKKEYGILDLSK